MSTRTFTLEALRTACAKIVAPIWVAPQLEAALLAAQPEDDEFRWIRVRVRKDEDEAAKPEAPCPGDGSCGGTECTSTIGPRPCPYGAPRAAKPEAKTCEPAPEGLAPGWYDWGGHGPCELCRRGRPGSDGAVYEFRKHDDATKQTYVCHYCAERMGAFNPAPAASPPAWLPLGQHPGGKCRSWCGASGLHSDACRTELCFSLEGRHHCSAYCRDRAKAVPRDAQPGVPDGWKLGEGWTLLGVPDPIGCCYQEKPGRPYLCDEPAPYEGGPRGSGACPTHAVEMGAIVPVEPSRPVTGEAVAPIGFRVVGRSGPGVALPSKDAPLLIVGARFTDGEPNMNPGAPFLRSSPIGATRKTWDAGCYDILEPITPPAPGNHPGTPTAPRNTCLPCDLTYDAEEELKACPVCYGLLVPEHVAPGKPDEAPLSVSDRIRGWVNLHLEPEHEDNGFAFAREVAALEAKLAEAKHWWQQWENQYNGLERNAKRWTEEHKAQLATRDARIAGLEASYAADKAAAVLEAKAAGVRACYAAMIDGNVPDGTSDFEEGDNLMMAEVLKKLGIGWEDLNGSSGAPAPTGGTK